MNQSVVFGCFGTLVANSNNQDNFLIFFSFSDKGCLKPGSLFWLCEVVLFHTCLFPFGATLFHSSLDKPAKKRFNAGHLTPWVA